MKRLAMMTALVSALAGCGGTADPQAETERPKSPRPPSNEQTTTETRTDPRAPHSPRGDERSPTYETAKELCEIIGVRGMADEYGGNPGSPITVARSFAEDSKQPWAHQDTIDGCMAGFDD